MGIQFATKLYRNIDVDESEDEVTANPTRIFDFHAFNLSASVLFLKFYDGLAADVTVGSTTPTATYCVPTSGDTNGNGFIIESKRGLPFATALTVAATTGVADNDTGAPGANELIIVLNLE